MTVTGPRAHDEAAVRTLLAAAVGTAVGTAVGADPQDGPPHPPALAPIERRVRQRRRSRRTAAAAAGALLVAAAATTVVAVPHLRSAHGAPAALGGTEFVDYVTRSASMEPTLRVGETLLIDPTARTLPGLKRGDVILFRDPGGWLPPAPSGSAEEVLLVKRVIGLPGDTITCCDAEHRLTLNGAPLAEPYVRPGDAPSTIHFSVTVAPGRLWVMGDNRSESADSRLHRDLNDGQVPIADVDGLVIGVVDQGSLRWVRDLPAPTPTESGAPRPS